MNYDNLNISQNKLNNIFCEYGKDKYCSLTEWVNGKGVDITFENKEYINLDYKKASALLSCLFNVSVFKSIPPHLKNDSVSIDTLFSQQHIHHDDPFIQEVKNEYFKQQQAPPPQPPQQQAPPPQPPQQQAPPPQPPPQQQVPPPQPPQQQAPPPEEGPPSFELVTPPCKRFRIKKTKVNKDKLIDEICNFADYIDREYEAVYDLVYSHECNRDSSKEERVLQSELEKKLDLVNYIRNLFQNCVMSCLEPDSDK